MFNVGDNLTQPQINGIMSLYCNLHYNVVNFDYTAEVVNTPYCDIQIKSGLYTDEELIVDHTLNVDIRNPVAECCNFYLKLKYYDYDADQDPNNAQLKEDIFLIENGKIEFGKLVYIMLKDWKLVVRYNKHIIKPL